MADEVELKFLNIDIVTIEAKLKKLGAKKKFDTNMRNIMFFHKKIDVDSNDSSKLFLRLREIDGVSYLTFKGPNKHATMHVRDEYETKIDDIETTLRIFKELGFSFKEFAKVRRHYELGKWHFEIDTWKGLPTFLEVEAATPNELIKACDAVGLDYKKGDKRVASEIWPDYFK